MIISKIRGGLGNQLFQWASGYALAQKNRTSLLLDTSVYERNKVRQYELAKLGLELEFASNEQIEKLQSTTFYKQPVFHFDPNFSDLSDNSFIRGYFCSEKYFLKAATEIKSTLSKALPSAILNSSQQELLDKIKTSNSVSMHIRRGDYAANESYNNFFGTCPLSYYKDAIKTIFDKCGKDLNFFIFSDDLDWARANLSLEFETQYADVNSGHDSYLDLLFMSQCKHNIIANSTFSWWAAWINTNQNKMVIAPKQWFKHNYREKAGQGVWIKSPYYDFSDLFPVDWVAI